MRERLAAAPDLARALARLVLGRGGPRDLAAIRDGLLAAAALAAELDATTDVAAEVEEAAHALCAPDPAIAAELEAALAETLAHLKRDGGFVRAGYDTALDQARALRDESRRVIAALQSRYAETTSVRALKIRHNNVLGYFVEVTAQHGDKLFSAPLNATFIHRQTLAGQVRFTTAELGELESRIASAADRALAIELETFDTLAAKVTAAAETIKAAAEALAILDVAAALAELAVERRYVRPQIDGSLDFVIEGGRHPVVEQMLATDGGPFVANDCDLSPPSQGTHGRIYLLTGPNMAGKSTYLRQNALIAILAQIGSFVPARRARIGAVDRLFSRVGAADDIARGRSTFMVEMVETAAILNQAGERALVILDEIGRGTATFDGLSIAWATDRASARGQPLPRFVRHPLPRADRAGGQAAASLQRHHARQGMAWRGGVPARGDPWLGRSQLRHPGGEARRLAGRRDRAGKSGSRQAGSRGPRLAARLREPAAFRGGAAAGLECRSADRRRHDHCRAGGASSRRNVAARGARSALCVESKGRRNG